jgi:pimeloyl-ACP methyl ester carboxylesterase
LAQLFIKNDDLADISFVDNIKNTDPNFRFVLGESFKTDKTNDFDLINNITIPIAMIFGEKDRIINLDTLKNTNIENVLWRNKIQIISDTGHSPMWEKPNMFNYVLKEFIKEL